MDKELFLQSMDAIKRQLAFDRNATSAFSVLLPNCFVSYDGSSIAISQIVEILKIQMKDQIKYSWIDYFVYELDSGEKYTYGCATNNNGDNIDLSSAESLYEFLLTSDKT